MALVRLTREEARGKLPFVCVRCGAPALGFRTKRSWYPPWANVFVFVLFLPLLILTKRVTLRLPFCSDHYDHWFLRSVVVWGSLPAALVLSVMLTVTFIVRSFPAEPDKSVALGVVYGTLFCWTIFATALQQLSVRPCQLTKEFVVIRGVAPSFVQALKERCTPDAVAGSEPEVIDDKSSQIREGYPPWNG